MANYRVLEELEMAAAVFFLLLLWPLVSESRRSDRREESLYDVLGVSKNAEAKEIRKAYKRLAREWHPDKNKSPRAQEKIMEINKAYEVGSLEAYRMCGYYLVFQR